MKKLFTSIVATLMAASLALPMAACGGGGGASSKNIVSDIVTKEEWDAAFAEENFTNFKLEYTLNVTREYLGDEPIDESEDESMDESEDEPIDVTLPGDKISTIDEILLLYEDGKLYYNYKAKGKINVHDSNYPATYNESREYYVDFTNGLQYEKIEGQWITTDIGIDGLIHIYKNESVTEIIEAVLVSAAPNSFYDYEYSEDDKGYKWREKLDNGYTEGYIRAIRKFKEGRLAGGNLEINASTINFISQKTTLDFVFTYGGQTVTLPDISAE